MTVSSPSGARPRRGRPRHHDTPRTRSRARHDLRTTEGGEPGAAAFATQLTTVVEVDLTGVPPEAVVATVAAAAVRSVREHSSVIGRVDPGTGAVVRPADVHLGVLTDDGTVVVVGAGDLTIDALRRRIADGTRSDVRTTTLDVVDTGSLGALLDTPVLGPDRSTVLGIGAVVRRPVVMVSDGGEAIAVRAVAHLSLSYDPRVLAGAEAARFLQSVSRTVEESA